MEVRGKLQQYKIQNNKKSKEFQTMINETIYNK